MKTLSKIKFLIVITLFTACNSNDKQKLEIATYALEKSTYQIRNQSDIIISDFGCGLISEPKDIFHYKYIVVKGHCKNFLKFSYDFNSDSTDYDLLKENYIETINNINKLIEPMHKENYIGVPDSLIINSKSYNPLYVQIMQNDILDLASNTISYLMSHRIVNSKDFDNHIFSPFDTLTSKKDGAIEAIRLSIVKPFGGGIIVIRIDNNNSGYKIVSKTFEIIQRTDITKDMLKETSKNEKSITQSQWKNLSTTFDNFSIDEFRTLSEDETHKYSFNDGPDFLIEVYRYDNGEKKYWHMFRRPECTETFENYCKQIVSLSDIKIDIDKYFK